MPLTIASNNADLVVVLFRGTQPAFYIIIGEGVYGNLGMPIYKRGGLPQPTSHRHFAGFSGFSYGTSGLTCSIQKPKG